MPTITMAELEATINRCAKARPPIDYVLGPDLRELAEVYGEMIYRHINSFELASQPSSRREVIERWRPNKETMVCGVSGEGGCEACQ
jgi:hypothetical protein